MGAIRVDESPLVSGGCLSVAFLCDELFAVHQSDASDDKYPGSLYTLEDPDPYYLCDRSSDKSLTLIYSECPGLP